jgi:hypothetical protein
LLSHSLTFCDIIKIDGVAKSTQKGHSNPIYSVVAHFCSKMRSKDSEKRRLPAHDTTFKERSAALLGKKAPLWPARQERMEPLR